MHSSAALAHPSSGSSHSPHQQNTPTHRQPHQPQPHPHPQQQYQPQPHQLPPRFQPPHPTGHPYSLPQPPYSISLQPPDGPPHPYYSAPSSLPPPPPPGFFPFPQPFAPHLPYSQPLPQPPPLPQPQPQPQQQLASHASPPPPAPPAAAVDQLTGELPAPLVAQLQQLRLLSQHFSPDQLAALGIDQQTLATLAALNALNAAHPLPSLPPPATASTSVASTASLPVSPVTSPALPGSGSSSMSYRSDFSKRHRDGDSASLQKRSKAESHATTPSSASDRFSPSPRRRRAMDRSGDEYDRDRDLDRGSDSGGSDNDSDVSNGSETADDSPMPSSGTKKRTEEEKVRNELQRKRQHQKSDKQRRAKIKDGMEQLKALVSQHGKLESPDQASIVSASVELVHSLRQEISGLKAEVERTRGENVAMKQRGLAGYGGLDAVMRGQLGALGQSPLGQLQLSQLSSLQALNSQLSSLTQQQQQANPAAAVSQQQLSGLNTLNNINMLSSLGLPTNINAAAQYQPAPSHHAHNHAQSAQQPHQGIHSPLPMMPMQSPPPLSMPASHGSNGFTSQFLTHSPPATGMMYGKEWQ